MSTTIESQDGKPIRITQELKFMLLSRLKERRAVLEAQRNKQKQDVRYKPIILELKALNRSYWKDHDAHMAHFKALKTKVARMSGGKDNLESYYNSPDQKRPRSFAPKVEIEHSAIFDANKKYNEIAVKLQYEKSVDINAILKQIDNLQ